MKINNKIRKFKFGAVVSENSHESHLIERIMFLENKIEKLCRSVSYYQYQRHISAEFASFIYVKINDVEIDVIDAMKLEIFKVRKQIIKHLEEYIKRKQEVDSGIFGRLSIDKGYKQMMKPEQFNEDYKKIKEEDLVGYVENSELISMWGDKQFEELNALAPLHERRLNHKDVKSKVALEIVG